MHPDPIPSTTAACRLPGFALALFFMPALLVAAPSVSFSLSPNESGQIEPSLSASWDWNAKLGARLDFSADNSTEYDDELEGFASSLTTVNQNLSGRVDPLVFALRQDGLRLALGAGVGVDSLNIRETGYFDYSWAPFPDARVFLNNVQKLLLVKPGLSFEAAAGSRGASWFEASVTYVPWMYIGLDQDFSSSSVEDPAAWTTPRTERHFDGSSTNGWTVGLKCGLTVGILELAADGTLESARYDYDMLDFGASIIERDSDELEWRGNLLASSPAVKLGSLQPYLGIGFSGTRSQSRTSSGAEPVTATSIRYSFGFATR
jgi:hypothetical protein